MEGIWKSQKEKNYSMSLSFNRSLELPDFLRMIRFGFLKFYMKKLRILLIVLFISTMAFGQNDYFSGLKNEIKINAPYAFAGALELSYERILSEDTGVGISAAFPISDDLKFDYFLLPFARAYFGKKEAAGFFGEIHLAAYSDEQDDDTVPAGQQAESFNGLGLGFSLGFKLFSKSHWSFEAVGGLGRNFQNQEEIGELYPRYGILLGRRF